MTEGRLRYRPEIDGLRGLAVLCVVLYHAQLGCPGGYVGVDVFFVISGYLITALVSQQLQAGRFSLAGFWEARLRRLFPALGLMVLAILGAGPFLLGPEDLRALANSVLAQSVLGANVYFWQTTVYWDTAADLKPLLHTWSLAVEEQFYLLLPVLLYWFGPRGRWLGAVAMLSLGVSAWGVITHPTATFYLLPTRAWEIALGGLLALHPVAESPRWQREALAAAGLLLVVAPVFVYTSQTPFPGLAALTPCCGTAMLLYANQDELTALGRMLAWRGLVALGLVSYSWYLWHWPLLAYLRYCAPTTPDLNDRVLCLLAALVVAGLSWKFVETPWRRRRLLPRRRPFLAACAALWALVFVGAGSVRLGPPLLARLFPQVPAGEFFVASREPDWSARTDLASARRGDFLPLGDTSERLRPTFLLWGDSHGLVMRAVLDRSARAAGRRGVSALWDATPPILGYVNHYAWSLGPDSLPYQQAVLDYVQRQGIRDVILCARWTAYAEDPGVPEGLERTLRELEKLGCTVWVLKQPPEYPEPVPQALKRAARRGEDPAGVGLSLQAYRRQSAPMDRLLERYRQPHTRVLDPTPYFYTRPERARVLRDAVCLYCNEDHLSLNGADELQPLWDEVMRATAAK